jgi:hypothetical protein
MKVLVTDRQVKQQEGTEAELQRSAHMALMVGLCTLGIASAYFVALYLVAR